jgi:hypothetical protein
LEVVVFLLWVSTGFSGSFLARKISQQQKKKNLEELTEGE